tara:strand:+ start:524 stop:775 length:252 start_codon:yes stop_codon:yes gene_type:complete
MKKGQIIKINKQEFKIATYKTRIMNKQEFKQTIKIYKSHTLKNNFISITYATILDSNTVSTETTIQAYNNGGALNSLYIYLFK